MKRWLCTLLATALAACGGGGQPLPEATAPPQPTATKLPSTVAPTLTPAPSLPAPSPTPKPTPGGLLLFKPEGVSLQLANLPPAPNGKVYVGWLGEPGGQLTQTGVINPAAGEGTLYADPQGRNLIGLFNAFQITVEDAAGVVDLKSPAGPIVLSGSVAPEALDVLRQILVESDAPGGKGLAASLLKQADVLFQHAKLASDALTAGDLRGAKMHAEHVINIAAGKNSPDFGDYNGDGRADNPGDGFGVAAYARRQIDLVQTLGESGVDEQMRGVILAMTACAANTENRALEAILAAKGIISATDVNAAGLVGVRMVAQANAADQGTDANNNGIVENVKDECGAAQLVDIVRRLAEIPLR